MPLCFKAELRFWYRAVLGKGLVLSEVEKAKGSYSFAEGKKEELEMLSHTDIG